MSELIGRLKKWILLPLAGFLLFFLLIAVNQSLQLVTWGFAVHPAFGWILLVLAVAAFVGLILYPLASILRFRVMPEIPADPASPEYTDYVQELHAAYRQHKLVLAAGLELPGTDPEAELQGVFRLLDQESDRLIKKQASQVFLTTAISQNGSLDGVFVLTAVIRMLWQIIHLYEVRPSLRRIVYLYSNVAASVLVARSLEDLDLIEDQIEPLISSLIGGSVMTLLPGAVPVTTLVVTSVTEGSVNALLALRCGCLAQRYLGSLSRPDRRLTRRSASLEATAMLGEIMKENTLLILRAFAKATKNTAAGITVNRFRKKKPPVRQEETGIES